MSKDDFDLDEQVVEALRAAGAPPEITASASKPGDTDGDHFEVWPENWDSLSVFLALGSVWSWVTPGVGDPLRVGIPATEIKATFWFTGIKKRERQRIFQDIRAMERAALDVFSARA